MSVNDVSLPTNCYGRGKLSQDGCPHQILSYDCISSVRPQFLYESNLYGYRSKSTYQIIKWGILRF